MAKLGRITKGSRLDQDLAFAKAGRVDAPAVKPFSVHFAAPSGKLTKGGRHSEHDTREAAEAQANLLNAKGDADGFKYVVVEHA